MELLDEQAVPDRLAGLRGRPSLRLAAAMAALAAVFAAAFAWGEQWSLPPVRTGEIPAFRYVNSGWIAPVDAQDAGVFSDELRAFVIVSQEELDAFEDGYVSKVSRGNTTTLNRIDFDRAALVAAYFIWRPVRGDPLTVAEVRASGGSAVVELELSYDPQGREYPYMYAPMVMVAVERSLFPEDEAVEFVFNLNGEPAVTLTAMPNRGTPSP